MTTTTAGVPTYLRMTHQIDDKFVVEYKISPYGDSNPDGDSFFVDTLEEAKMEVARLKDEAAFHARRKAAGY